MALNDSKIIYCSVWSSDIHRILNKISQSFPSYITYAYFPSKQIIFPVDDGPKWITFCQEQGATKKVKNYTRWDY